MPPIAFRLPPREVLFDPSFWLCLLFGHRWGPRQESYEDTGYSMVMYEAWRDCERCGGAELLETWRDWMPTSSFRGRA